MSNGSTADPPHRPGSPADDGTAAPDTAAIGNVLCPRGDVAASVAFYRDGLGFSVLFTDGDRFAALDGGGTTLAIAARGEDVADGVPAVSVRVTDVERATAALVRRGGEVARPAEAGPHETRAVVRDPDGHPVVLYARHPRPA